MCVYKFKYVYLCLSQTFHDKNENTLSNLVICNSCCSKITLIAGDKIVIRIEISIISIPFEFFKVLRKLSFRLFYTSLMWLCAVKKGFYFIGRKIDRVPENAKQYFVWWCLLDSNYNLTIEWLSRYFESTEERKVKALSKTWETVYIYLLQMSWVQEWKA